MYRRSLVSFIDILGFRHLIATSTFEQVAKKLAALKRFSGRDEDDGDGLEPRVIQFSDSIIRVRPLDGKANLEFPYGMLFHELHDLVFMQGELIKHGVCIRGGVAIGDVYFDSRTIFGPGFVRAYEMESQFANFPRIVIDPQVLQDLMREGALIAQHHDVAEEIRHIRQLVRKDSDGLFFVDYLEAFLPELDEPEFQPVVLRDHRQMILDGVGKGAALNGVSAKYVWLANYHNALVARIPQGWFDQYGMSPSDVAVGQDELPMNFDWPRDA